MTQGKSMPLEGIITKIQEIDETKFPEYNKDEKKEEKYKQLEFEFDEDLVAPI